MCHTALAEQNQKKSPKICIAQHARTNRRTPPSGMKRRSCGTVAAALPCPLMRAISIDGKAPRSTLLDATDASPCSRTSPQGADSAGKARAMNIEFCEDVSPPHCRIWPETT